MRVRRAHEVDVTHPVPLDIVDEDALPLRQALVLLARDVLALPLLSRDEDLSGRRRKRDLGRSVCCGLVGEAGTSLGAPASLRTCHRLHGFEDVPVAGAAAEVALERFLDLLVGR